MVQHALPIVKPSPATWELARDPGLIAALAQADISAYMLGALDAERGEAFCPEQYFAWDGDLLAYAEGFEAVRGESEITRDFKRGIVEAVDLEEDMADREYHARGLW